MHIPQTWVVYVRGKAEQGLCGGRGSVHRGSHVTYNGVSVSVMWYVTVMWCGLPKLCDFLSTSTTVTNLTHCLLRWQLIPRLRLGLCLKKWTIVPLSTAAEKPHRFCHGLRSKLWTAFDQRLQSMVFNDLGSNFNLQQNGHHFNAPFMLITMVQVPALYLIEFPSQRYLA